MALYEVNETCLEPIVLSLFNLMFLLYKTVGLNYFQEPRCASFYDMAYAGSNSCRILAKFEYQRYYTYFLSKSYVIILHAMLEFQM
jgi:hypothetical protein